jgi:hypothetical protein
MRLVPKNEKVEEQALGSTNCGDSPSGPAGRQGRAIEQACEGTCPHTKFCAFASPPGLRPETATQHLPALWLTEACNHAFHAVPVGGLQTNPPLSVSGLLTDPVVLKQPTFPYTKEVLALPPEDTGRPSKGRGRDNAPLCPHRCYWALDKVVQAVHHRGV